MDAKVQHFEGGTSHRHQTYDGPNGLDTEASGVKRDGSWLKEDDYDSGIEGQKEN